MAITGAERPPDGAADRFGNEAYVSVQEQGVSAAGMLAAGGPGTLLWTVLPFTQLCSLIESVWL